MAEIEIRQILGSVIKKGYIDLLNHDIQVDYKKLDDALADYGELKPEGFFIEVDNIVKGANNSVKIGVLASELSHIAEDVKTSSIGRLKDRFLCRVSKKYRIKDERNADLTTVLRGFGQELLDTMRFAEENGFPYYREDGLSVRELEILVGKNNDKRDS